MAAVVRWITVKLLPTIGTLIPSIVKLVTSGSASSSTAIESVQALEQLERRLRRIEAVLDDAEEREIQDKSVRLWLKEIKEVAYDAEDVLDEYEYELLRSRIEGRTAPESAETPSSSTSSSSRKRKLEEMEEQVCGSTSSSCSLVSPIVAKDLVGRINKINGKFDEIAKDRDALRLREEDGPRRKDDWMIPQPTGSHVDESGIYGREEDKAKTVHLLSSGDERFTVLPIVGMGGLGKTTLAQLVYNDERFCGSFDLRGWIHVSVHFDVIRLTRAIIESFTGQSLNLAELSALQHAMKMILTGKRVFLVLDDIWNEKQSAWDLLKGPLVGAKEIKILITTRNDSVAQIMQTMPPYRLHYLTEEKSWFLFQRHAFADRDANEHPILMKIGRQIVKKCGGLPLAVKIIGGLMRYKEANEKSWEDIRQSNIWELNETQDEILPALRLSYHYMPVYLKPCFVYCCLFPKDHRLKDVQVIQLWVAQGYISKPRGAKSTEDLGREYVAELQRRSLFQSAGHRFFQMHHLVHDLASSISEKECHQVTLESDAVTYNIPSTVRHLRVVSRLDIIPCRLFSSLPKALRTLIFDGFDSHAVLEEQFPLENLRCLRALELCFHRVQVLPDAIGDLKHLRYLRVDDKCPMAKIKLPESIGQLYYLQVLAFRPNSVWGLAELPGGTGNLGNLSCLSGVDGSTCMPRGMGKLTDLKTLFWFNVRRGGWHCGIEELKGLVNLRGDLRIGGLRNVARAEDAREANLGNKQQVGTLALAWGGGDCGRHAVIGGEEQHSDAELEASVLENLRPCANLSALQISQYGGARYPRWMGDPSFSRLARVQLLYVRNCERLPALGQLPSLRYLNITWMNGLRYVGREFCCENIAGKAGSGCFPSLRRLEFHDMLEWEEWCGVADGDFPRLSQLLILDCPKLRSLTLPPTLSALVMLVIVDCALLESVTGLQNLPSLQKLVLRGCSQLCLSPEQPLPPTLRELIVDRCGKLSIVCLHQDATALRQLQIKDCPCLWWLLGLHRLASLRRLILTRCPELRIPPYERLPSISSYVIIEDCPGLIEWYQAHRQRIGTSEPENTT